MELTTAPKLKDEILEAIRKSSQIKNRLQLELDKSYPTLNRWLKTNDDNLTKVQVLNIVSDELGIAKDELLTA